MIFLATSDGKAQDLGQHGVIDTIKKTGENAKELFENIDWKESGETVVNLQRDGLEYLKGKVPDKLAEIGKAAIAKFKGLAPDFIKSGMETIKNIVSGIRELADSIPSQLRNIGSSAANAFRNINWYNLGVNIVQGIINGIVNNVNALIRTVQNMASSALNSAMSFLGIASPSKKFRDLIGKNMALGIGVGFTKNLPIKEMQGALQKAVDMASDIDTEGLLDIDLADVIGIPTKDIEESTIDIQQIESDDQPGAYYPGDNITINVYPREEQDEKSIAEEVLKYLTMWDNQKKRVYA